ncbi:hypothetical protein LAZ67_20001115 [Cordylochernes scorpioides]|uniref:Tc1-like transposase DDE domain-containing protein n=1 Tax=Cordylochernes scorpioides TaxID=51811 RepID=A0ABY6LM04_9ARAC|nr:hypothetical protein LAZ67_20001115 [Cordylochernes scorpioides]
MGTHPLHGREAAQTLEQAHNHQNDRSWSAEAPSMSGKTFLIFGDQGVRINQEVYRRDILEAVVLPWAQQHYSDANWTFQQDSVPAHKTKLTQDWCRAHFTDLITSAEWPLYSPDLNPMDTACGQFCRPGPVLYATKAMIIMQFDFALTNVTEPRLVILYSLVGSMLSFYASFLRSMLSFYASFLRSMLSFYASFLRSMLSFYASFLRSMLSFYASFLR